jgi:hypothetical protein
MLRTIWGDNDRYVKTYWEKFSNRYYVAGDSAHRDKDGYFWIMGRIDDVLNVAGHRLGTMEIESALVAHPKVAEAAVVAKPHDIKGESVFAYVVLNVKRPEGEEAKKLMVELRNWVGEQLSPIAKPDDIRLTDNLPKTRSGKIMRRLLRSVARGEDITQDMSTLENPAILEQLRGEDDGAPQSKKTPPASKAKPQPPAKPSAKAKAKAKATVKAKPKAALQAKVSGKSKRTALKSKTKLKTKAAAKKSAVKKAAAKKAKSRAAAKRKPRRKK